jgi:aminoglycoside phosphotransferase (APT) family kinase protein
MNYAIDQKFVLRVYSGDQSSAACEARILELAAKAGVHTPSVVEMGEVGGRGLLILTLMPGRMLDRHADFEDVGAQLARIHSVSFEDWGLFGSDGSLETFSPGTGASLVADYLEGRAGQRLGSRRTAAVRALPPVHLHPRAPTLVHSDFNPKNILVGQDGRVTAILDWEFAMAADPLIDFGNFFRFPEDYESEAQGKFVAGYEGAGGRLPEDWVSRAQLHDLVSLLDFLNREKDLPETFATALDRVDCILDSHA